MLLLDVPHLTLLMQRVG